MENIPCNIPFRGEQDTEETGGVIEPNDPMLFFYGGFGPSRLISYSAIQREAEASRAAEERRENKRKPPKPPRGLGRTILGHGF
ncbi:hypothetical protein KW803_03090 [Candidatus Saccharibacteria bacterium]|nr:hypothetical protein [Candidatus Saccharibacteria bacterium]